MKSGSRAGSVVVLGSALALLLAAAPVHAQEEDEDAPRRWEANAVVWMTSPVALNPGLVLGGIAEGRRVLGGGPFYLGARLGIGGTSGSTEQWVLTHWHGLANAVAGVQARAGSVGLLRAQLEAGALVIRQIGERQQYQRLKNSGFSDLARDGWSSGPYVGLDLGLEVAFAAAWRAVLMLGPAYTAQTVDGSRTDHWLLATALGVGHAF